MSRRRGWRAKTSRRRWSSSAYASTGRCRSRRSRRPFTVRCDRLMRIDFVAAGSVLNWVAECQQKNALVRFSNLHRLNAVFFNLIGINEHSIVNQREN